MVIRGHIRFDTPHESPVNPWNSIDISLYWQKSAQLDGQIAWDVMTLPCIHPCLIAFARLEAQPKGGKTITTSATDATANILD